MPTGRKLVHRTRLVSFIIRLENERGVCVDEVSEEALLLEHLLPMPEDKSFYCWRFIDLYGNTVFNRLQMPAFVKELDRLSPNLATLQDKQLLARIREMAERCGNEAHLYLKFYGD
jgi:hypothetical protein